MQKLWHLLVAVCLLTAAPAMAATDYTCHLTGESSGATDFVGTDAVEQAFRAIDADEEGNGSTVTITESGVYEGIVATTKQGLTLQVAAGVQPILRPPAMTDADPLWQAGTITLGRHYDGSFGWGTMAVIGDSPENRMIVESYGNDIQGYWVNNGVPGNSVTNVEFRNGSTTTGTWAMCRQLTFGEVFTNCLWNGTHEAGINQTALLNANGDGVPGPSFVDCVFDTCGTLFHVGFTDRNDPTASLTGCTFIGQAGENDFNLTRANANGTDTVLDFDACTFVNLGSYPFWIDGGLTINLTNSTVTPASGNWICFADVLDGYLNVTNCTIEGDRIFSRYSTVQGVGANVTIDRSHLIGSGVVEVTGEGCTIDTGITYTVTNSLIEGDGTNSPLVWAFKADEAFPNPALTLDHCTLFGVAEYLIRSKAQEATPLVTNCILDGSACIGGNEAVRTGWATLDAASTNNIFWDDSAAEDGEAGWADGMGSLPGTVIIADPLLDATGHLMDGSPALGMAVGSTMTHDYDGDARPLPDGTDPDIGADEVEQVEPLTITRVGGANQAVDYGESVSFVVEIENAVGDYTIEWFFNDGTGAVAIPDSDALILVLPDVTDADVGTYYCVVTDDNGPLEGPHFSLSLLTGLPVAAWPLLVLLPGMAALALRRRR